MSKDYKKLYEEALERAKEFKSPYCQHAAEVIFPELKESEDERIRKAILKMITDIEGGYPFEKYGIIKKDAIAWLEKQGEQKPIDESKPKFKVGDWITTVNDEGGIAIEKVVEFLGNKVRLIDTDGVYMLCPQGLLNHYHLWTIEDAKDGDVLANKYGAIFINAGSNGGVTLDCYCYLSVQNKFCIEEHKTGSWLYKNNIKPATKEQCDLLFQKMHEAGYEWDDEKKELKKIEQKPVEWSEEDEDARDIAIRIIQNGSNPSNLTIGSRVRNRWEL